MSKAAEKRSMMIAIRNIKDVLRDAEQDILNDDERNRLSAYKTVSALCQALIALHESEDLPANDEEVI